MVPIDTAEFLQKVKAYGVTEQISAQSGQFDAYDPKLVAAVYEIAKDSKSILGGLYYDFRKSEQGLARKLKNLIIEKIANIVRNTLERPLQTQQKFNEQVYYLLTMLQMENSALKAEIAKLNSQSKSI